MGETKQIVQVNGGNILLFELAFRLLTLPLLLQAVAALFRLSVRASGYSYVTVSNLVSYLLRPVTIAILVLMAAILLVGVSIEAAGLLAANERFFDVCGRHPSDGIRDPKAESAVVSGAGGSRPGASFIFDLPDVMPCEGGQIYPSSASGGELGAAFTGWRDCWRGCDFTSDDFYLFWLYAGAAVVSGRISAKQGVAAR